MELYPKIALNLLVSMGLMRTSTNKSQHHIVLFNYQDTDTIITEVSNFFGLEPLERTEGRAKEVRDEGTCPAVVSHKFHMCNDKTLTSQNLITNIEAEHERRKNEHKKLLRAVYCLRGNQPIGCQQSEKN